MKNVHPRCLHCDRVSELVSGKDVYSKRPDLAHLPFYRCAPCAATVGCHRGTEVALGSPANEATRRARHRLHQRFDPLWKCRVFPETDSRGKAYRWLASVLRLESNDCHIGRFTVELCRVALNEIDTLEERGLTE